MNPYLERPEIWEMFHSNFVNGGQTALAAKVRPRYTVRIEHRDTIHEPPAEERGRAFARADVLVSRTEPRQGGVATAGVETAPYTGTVPTGIDITNVPYLEIRDRSGRRVVTMIELLSPSNKQPGPDREQFLGKRFEVLRSRANYVELDLLRGGPRLPVEGLPPCDYYAMVSRPERRPKVGLWPWALRDPMPEIAIPLDPDDADVRLDLKAILDEIYDSRFYGDILYDEEPVPGLAPRDAAWAETIVDVARV
jgi:hypothetical protein